MAIGVFDSGVGGLSVHRALVQRFPEHSLADNALYWTGRALTDEKDLDGAATAYETLLSRYPTGNKVPDALLALGSVLAQKGRLADAQEKLRLLVKTFPATKAAKQAVSRLREMKP